jgi:hypothetical protein
MRYIWLPLVLALVQGARTDGAPPPSSPPALLRLPAFDGEFSGEWLMPQTGLKFHWRIVVESPADAPGARRAHVDITGHGAHVVALV